MCHLVKEVATETVGELPILHQQVAAQGLKMTINGQFLCEVAHQALVH